MDGLVDLVNEQRREGYGLSFRVLATGRVFRLQAARDPAQPRLWGFRVDRCAAAGSADPDAPPWFGAAGMTREDLPAAIESIRADVAGWLAREELAELRAWILAAPPSAARPFAPQPAASWPAQEPATRS